MAVESATREEIVNYLLQVLEQEKQIDISNINMSDEIKTLNIDSFGFLEVIFNIEHQFNISFPKNYEHIRTLDDVVNVTFDLIQAKNN